MKRLITVLGAVATSLSLAACDAVSSPLSFEWPPEAGETYPALELLGLDGETVELASYRGKVLLIEPIGMT